MEGAVSGPPLILPADWRQVANPSAPAGHKTFMHRDKPLVAIRSRDMGRWHLSVSHRDRVPTWGELGMARDALLPADGWFMVAHPPRRYWLNYNPRVLHLWEFQDDLLIGLFRHEGTLAQGTRFAIPDDGGL
jgi:hypothetical protein